MTLRFAGFSTKGLRPANEDAFLAASVVHQDEERDTACPAQDLDTAAGRQCFALADGMGGHDAGEVAARLALAGLAEAVEAIPQGGLGEPSLREAILAAHARVAACGAETGKPDMGCTLTGCIFGDGGAWAFNVGDSRCYLLQRGFARQITVDHSANSLPGLQSLGRNVIYSCIGGRYSPAQIDIFPLTPSLEPGIVFILCSDGFHEFAGADEIEAAFLPGPAAVDAPLCASLAAQALAAGSEDNVTVCAIGVF